MSIAYFMLRANNPNPVVSNEFDVDNDELNGQSFTHFRLLIHF